MKNIKVSEKQGKLILEVDLSKNAGMSKSGKNQLIATSGGNQKILLGDRTVTIGVNIW